MISEIDNFNSTKKYLREIKKVIHDYAWVMRCKTKEGSFGTLWWFHKEVLGSVFFGVLYVVYYDHE
ncbi:MAG: hypothetical protein HXS54_02525 [Theionarchaea archaeon]|nr:hypothetical protein [Theionarchaea archaeon]